jgi:hypothetical protein
MTRPAKVIDERWARWYSCSLCEQRYHGVVCCALGWACWKTYVGRPERVLQGPRRHTRQSSRGSDDA